jgi:hypothetical protein
VKGNALALRPWRPEMKRKEALIHYFSVTPAQAGIQ